MDQQQSNLADKSPLRVVSIVAVALLLALDAVALSIRLRSKRLQGLPLCLNDHAALLALVRTIKCSHQSL